MNFKRKYLSSLFFALAGCATAHVTPVGTGKTEWSANYGGPVTKLKGTVMPAPVLTASVTHGLNENLDVTANVPVTPLLFGLLMADSGVAWFPVQPCGIFPGVGIDTGLVVVTPVRPGAVSRRPLLFPKAASSAAWRVGSSGLLYAAMDALFLTEAMTYEEDAPLYQIAPLVGFRWASGGQTALTIELKKYAANWRTDQVAADLYELEPRTGLKTKHPQNGALGLILGYAWKS